MIPAARVAAVVLAAGASSRFGSQKLLAPLAGRPMLQHVLDVAAEAGFGEVVVVLGDSADAVDGAIAWHGERRVPNPRPEDGLSSSLRIGIAAVGAGVDAALVLLGDQPLVSPAAIHTLMAAYDPAGPPVVVPRYAGGGGQNPVLVARAAWPLADEATGDRGLGPVLRAHAGLVVEIPVAGSNPDVDTPDELAALERAGSSG